MNKFQQHCRKLAKQQIEEYWGIQQSYVERGYYEIVDNHTDAVYVVVRNWDNRNYNVKSYPNIEDAFYKKVKLTYANMMETDYFDTWHFVDVVPFVGK